MKKLFIIFFLFVVTFSNAQIYFTNPGLEGIATDIGNCVPPNWFICESTPDILPLASGCCPWYKPAYEGNTYVDLGAVGGGMPVSESFGQRLSCYMVPNHQHTFSCFVYSVNYFNQFDFGILQVWGGHSNCNKEEKLFESSPIDTVWHIIQISFTPTSNFDYIIFRNINYGPDDLSGSKVCIDALSEITVEDYNFFSSTASDTTIDAGACVSFIGASDDTAAVFYWSTVAGDSVATGDSINVCPSTTTTYIVTATLGCGQQFADTVTVIVIGGGGGTPIMHIPNLLTTDFPVWKIINPKSSMQVSLYNTLGQLIYHRSDYQNNLNINTLSSSTYFYEVKIASETYRGKLIVVR